MDMHINKYYILYEFISYDGNVKYGITEESYDNIDNCTEINKNDKVICLLNKENIAKIKAIGGQGGKN